MLQPKQARSRQTRQEILESAIALVIERGYPAASFAAIAARAGVSQGALLHHFPTRSDLVRAAFELAFDARMQEFDDALSELSADDPLEARVEALWTMVSGPGFAAWAELVVAARTDPVLREAVEGMSQRFTEWALANVFGDLPPAATGIVYPLLNGLMLDRMLDLNDELIQAALAELPGVLRNLRSG